MGVPISADSQALTEQTSRLDTVVRQLRTPGQLLEVLCATAPSIADVIACEGAAAGLKGVVHTTGNCEQAFAQQVIQQLSAANAWGSQVRELTLTTDSGACKSVLLLPFSRSESGWLFWVRSRDTAEEVVWSQHDIDIAAQLRHELMEVALERALDKGTVLQRLISTLGHSLCNPLQSISMSAALLKPHDNRSLELREHISVASEKMEQQINQALDMNRLQGDEHLRLNLLPINLSNLTASEVSRLRNSMPQLDLRASIDTDIEAVLDAQRLTQAIRHLLGNAAQYATPGSPVRLTLSTEAQNGEIRLTITNQSSALTPAQLGALQSASRYGVSGPQRGNRLGAGLYMARGIARAHGGELDIRQSGDRVEVQFSLPSNTRAQG